MFGNLSLNLIVQVTVPEGDGELRIPLHAVPG
jgi:hypothetical protein